MENSELQQAKELVAAGQAVLLDVRRQDEWDAGHAVEAFHFNSERVLEAGELPDYPKTTPIYLYCQSGGRAGRVKNALLSAGFENVTNVGGLSDWQG
jgi:rhodanese-related sulfurtransferase